MIKKDCLNYSKSGNGCLALHGTFCEKQDCKFYKTQHMQDVQTAKIRNRIPGYDPKKTMAEWYPILED